MAKKVVVAGACRTAIGKMGGALANVPATELGAIVIREALEKRFNSLHFFLRTANSNSWRISSFGI